MNRRSHLTADVLNRVVSSLSDRDRDIVLVVAKLRYLTTTQIQHLFFVDGTNQSNARSARLVLRRLTDLRVLSRLDRRIGGVRAGSAGQVYSLDLAGQFLLAGHDRDGRRRRPPEPSLLFVSHTLAVADLYVHLSEAARAKKIELLEFQAEPMCWRSFFGPGGARMTLKPDAFLRIGRDAYEDLWFIEVDRATESTTALTTKFRTYRQYWSSGKEQQRWGDVFPRVLWLAPTVGRVRQLIDIAARQPTDAAKLFTVRPAHEAQATLITENQP